jgi:hypothetical protein
MVDLIHPNNVSRVDDLLGFHVRHSVDIVSIVNRVPHEYTECSSVGQLPLNVILGRDNSNFAKSL